MLSPAICSMLSAMLTALSSRLAAARTSARAVVAAVVVSAISVRRACLPPRLARPYPAGTMTAAANFFLAHQLLPARR